MAFLNPDSWFSAAVVVPLLGWSGYLQRQVDRLRNKDAQQDIRLERICTKLDAIHDDIKELKR